MSSTYIHITTVRLLELAQSSTIVDKPEWKHVLKCKACEEGFISMVRESDGSKDRAVVDGHPTVAVSVNKSAASGVHSFQGHY